MKRKMKWVTAIAFFYLAFIGMSLNVQAAEKIPSGYTAVSTPEELNNIRNNLSGKYILTADIDLTNALSKGGSLYVAQGWVTIGSSSDPFTGILDGNGHTITGYRAGGGYKNGTSLIDTNNGTIKNLTIAGTSNAASAFCEANYGLIQNCHNKVTHSGIIEASRQWVIGGIVRFNSEGGVVEYCSNTVNLTGQVRPLGTSEQRLLIGGIVGTNNGTVRKCFNTGEITNYGYKGACAGAAGIVGTGGDGSLIENCYNSGRIYVDMESTGYDSANNIFSAGIMAQMYYQDDSTIKNCYNAGSVTIKNGTYHNKYVGAIAGSFGGGKLTFEKCYWLDGSCSQATSYGGSGSENVIKLSSTQMRTQSSFSGWNFTNVWSMGTNGYYYPVLTMGCTHLLDQVTAKNATCTNDGNIRYWYCNVCDKYFSNSSGTVEITEASTIIKAGHSWTEAEELVERLVAGSDLYCQKHKIYYYGCINCDAVSDTETFVGSTKGNHSMSATWSTENEKHYHGCLIAGCEYREDEASCSGGTATCTEKAKCAFCGEEYGTTLLHTWTEKEEVEDRLVTGTGVDCQDEKKYYCGCINCDAVSDTEMFVGSTKGNHSMSATWSTENEKHYHGCLIAGCEYREDEASCSGGTATCTEKAKCTFCGEEYGTTLLHTWTEKEEVEDRLVTGTGVDCQDEKKYYCGCINCDAVSDTEMFVGSTKGNHSMSATWSTENEKHYHGCLIAGCEYREDEASCSGGTATCTENAECEICGQAYGSFGEHCISNWQNDEKGHWKTCTNNGCEVVLENATHQDADHNGVCDVCGMLWRAIGIESPNTGDYVMNPWILLIGLSWVAMMFLGKNFIRGAGRE